MFNQKQWNMWNGNIFSWESIKKKMAFEQKVDKSLQSYIKREIKKEYSRSETFLAIQDKISKIKNFDFVSSCLKDIIENKRKVLLYCDYDNDWLSAWSEMAYFLKMFWVPFEKVFPGRKEDWYWLKVINLSQNEKVAKFIEESEKTNDPVYICSLDNWINNDEVSEILKNRGITYCSIDHHQPEDGFDNSYCMNPHLNKENIKDEENLCTGMLVFWFCLNMFDKIDFSKLNKADIPALSLIAEVSPESKISESEKISLKKDFLMNNFDLALLSTLSDYMRLDWINRAIVKNFQEDLLVKWRSGIKQLINVNADFMQRSKIYETLNFNVISLLNAVGRLKNMDMAYDFIMGEEWAVDVADLLMLNENKKVLVNDACKIILANLDTIVWDGKTLIYESEDIDGWIASIISTRMAMSLQTVTMIGHADSSRKVRFSIRSPFYWHMLKEEFKKIGYHYKWHNVAGVVEVDISEMDEFKKKVKNHFNSQQLESEWYEVLETIDDGNVLSVELIDQIYSYWPYWAGLKEPVFRVKGDFIKWSNWLFVWTSSSWKMQVMQMKVWDKQFRVNNKTGKDLNELDIKWAKSIIVRLGYPYPKQNKINLELVEIEK